MATQYVENGDNFHVIPSLPRLPFHTCTTPPDRKGEYPLAPPLPVSVLRGACTSSIVWVGDPSTGPCIE